MSLKIRDNRDIAVCECVYTYDSVHCVQVSTTVCICFRVGSQNKLLRAMKIIIKELCFLVIFFCNEHYIKCSRYTFKKTRGGVKIN